MKTEENGLTCAGRSITPAINVVNAAIVMLVPMVVTECVIRSRGDNTREPGVL